MLCLRGKFKFDKVFRRPVTLTKVTLNISLMLIHRLRRRPNIQVIWGPRAQGSMVDYPLIQITTE